MAEDLGYRLQSDAEESERLVLDRGRSGQRDERIVQCDRRDDGIAHQGREIGQQRAEAMHRQPIRGQARGLLDDSDRWTPRRRHHARTQSGYADVYQNLLSSSRQRRENIPCLTVSRHYI